MRYFTDAFHFLFNIRTLMISYARPCLLFYIKSCYMMTAWSTMVLCTCCSLVTKEYNWQIMSVMFFSHWLAACTMHLFKPLFKNSCTCNSHINSRLCYLFKAGLKCCDECSTTDRVVRLKSFNKSGTSNQCIFLTLSLDKSNTRFQQTSTCWPSSI